MSEQSTEEEVQTEPNPEPLKLDTPIYDYVEHGADMSGVETRDSKL